MRGGNYLANFISIDDQIEQIFYHYHGKLHQNPRNGSVLFTTKSAPEKKSRGREKRPKLFRPQIASQFSNFLAF